MPPVPCPHSVLPFLNLQVGLPVMGRLRHSTRAEPPASLSLVWPPPSDPVLDFMAKLRGSCPECPWTPAPSQVQVYPTILIAHQRGTFVTTDEPAWTGHCLLVPSPCVYPMGLDKQRIPHSHHYGIMQTVFPALKTLCSPTVCLFLSPLP